MDIPRNFRMMNDYAKYNNDGRLKFNWNEMKEEERANGCQSCGACESACPQGLPIREKLQAIAAKMSEI